MREMNQRGARSRILWLAVGASALLHAAPLLGPRASAWLDSPKREGADSKAQADPADKPTPFRSVAEIAEARRRLVHGALAARKAGTLRLGAFVLAADALDAEEARVELDFAEVRRLYDERCESLRGELQSQRDVPAAVTRAFSDLAYSMAVTRMSDLLLNKVGACGPSTQLIATCLYDAKQRAGLQLRFWGGVNQSGTTHITPTWTEAAREIDLVTGQPVAAGGARLGPTQIVEAYGRAHGILPKLPGTSAAPDLDAAATASFHYPPNPAVFESGEVPLFSQRGVGTHPRDPRGGRVDRAGYTDLSFAIVDADLLSALSFGAVAAGSAERVECVLSPRALAPRVVALGTRAGTAEVELLPVISPQGLSVLARAIARYEVAAPRVEAIDALVADACLSLSYDWAAPRFAAAGLDVIARESATRAKTRRESAIERHRKLASQGEAKLGEQVRTHPDHWTLVAFEAGARTLLALETRAPKAERPGPLPTTELEAMVNGQQRTQALLSDPTTRAALVTASTSFDLDRRMHFLGMFASFRILNPDVQLPQRGWLPGALAAYDVMLRAMGAGHFGSAGYFDASLDVLRAAGATPKQIAEREKLQQEVKRRLQRGELGRF